LIRSSTQNELVVIGLGNIHRRDDGIGVRLVERLDCDSIADVDSLIWGDSDSLSIANDLLELAKPALFVDCARMGLRPGDWRLFDETSVLFKEYSANYSTHSTGLGSALALARNLGYQHSVHFFGVEPEDVLLGDSLSDTLNEELRQLVGALRETVRGLVAERTGGD